MCTLDFDFLDNEGNTVRVLTVSDIGNQARGLMANFIDERLRVDGMGDIVSMDMILDPTTPTGRN